jgi:hypothetical protein
LTCRSRPPVSGVNALRGGMDCGVPACSRVKRICVKLPPSSVSVPRTPSSSPRSAFTPDTGGRERQVNVFWVGHNNFFDPQAVIADTGRCVDFLDSDRFIVLSLLNTGNEPPGSDPYLRKTQINDALAARYPDRYLDVRRILVERYDPERADDVADHANDAPPASLRSDEEHLNAAGYAVIADAVAAFIRSKGW